MSVFRFKQFYIRQADNAMKVGTDAMILGALADVSGRKNGLDIGAGTGVLSLMTAQKNPEIRMDAIELDELSAGECRINFNLSPWNDRLRAIHGDFLVHHFSENYDLIISNPPYFQSRLENADTRKATARHESYLPLEPMIEKVVQILSEEGRFWVIYPSEVQDEWNLVCNGAGLYAKRTTRIHGKEGQPVNRIVCCYMKGKQNPVHNQLVVRDASGKYTEAYIELTRAFHFNDLSR